MEPAFIIPHLQAYAAFMNFAAAAAAVTLAAQFGHNGAVGTVDISRDGTFVLSGSNDNSTRLWDADSGRLLRVHVDPDAEGVRVAALTGSRGLRARSTRGVSFAATAVAAPKGAKSKATPALEAWRRTLVRRDRFIYTDLARRSGAVVFPSSRGGELSYESPAWQNGLFTEELVRALTTSVADQNGDKG